MFVIYTKQSRYRWDKKTASGNIYLDFKVIRNLKKMLWFQYQIAIAYNFAYFKKSQIFLGERCKCRNI